LINLTQVDQLYSSFHNANLGLFNNHKISIEQQQQQQLLTDKVNILEERADDTVMLLLDLTDHELADSKLQRVISLSEQLENQFNSIISFAFEYRDIINESTAQLIESELLRSLNEAKGSVDSIIAELNIHGIEDISQDVATVFTDIQNLLSIYDGILSHKAKQLQANQQATSMLIMEQKVAEQVNKVTK